MFIQEISIEIKNPDIDRAELIDKMEWFIATTVKNGQSQDRFSPIYLQGNRLIWLTYALEKTSLSRKNDNIYVKQGRSELEKMCRAKFQVKTLGKDESNTLRVCRCKKPSSYILWTNYITVFPPLECGDCGGKVPLYRIIPKLPEPGKQKYFTIGCWEACYRACDELQMDCGFGERWGTRQMREHDSGLSKDGREVCRNIENMVGVPVYYYLYNNRRLTKEQDKQRKCPECGNDWLLDEPWCCFDFCCEPCRLVSNITYNSR